jgi:hypothetical protein
MLGQLGTVARTRGLEGFKCAKDFSKEKIASADACVIDDPKGKVAKARAKVADLEAKKCAELPGFGFVGSEAVAQAGVDAGVGALRDVFGVALDASVLRRNQDPAGAACQQALAISARKCLDARLKELARCVKQGLADGVLITPEGLEACLGADPKGKIAAACDLGFAGEKKVDGVRRALGKLCVAEGVAPNAVLEACPGANGVEEAHACLMPRFACRACRAADAAAALGTDCDHLDDGAANGSCPA